MSKKRKAPPLPAKRYSRKQAAKTERKNWHLTQLIGALLFAGDKDPEEGHTFKEADLLEISPADVAVDIRPDDETPGKNVIVVRIKKLG